MKRVTERSDLPLKEVPENISGCRQFEGEDLSKYTYTGYSVSIIINHGCFC